jgi:hypothetical protein
MFRAFVSLILVQAFVVAALLVPAAQAIPIPIQVLNNSFEDAAPAGDPTLSLTIANWTDMTNGTHYSQEATHDADGGICRLLLATPEAPPTIITPSAQIKQVLGTDLAANTKYSLTVAIGGSGYQPDGHGNFDMDGGAYDISLYAGGTELVSGSALHYIETNPLTFKDVTLTYTSGSGVPAGQALEIRLRGIANVQSPAINPQFWTVYDNVRLTSESVPEPGTLVLLVTGLIGLVCYAWRKRK